MYKNYCLCYGHYLHIKVCFAGNNRRCQGWNVICSPFNIGIFHYLQIQRAEISFSVRHQGINDIFVLKSTTLPSFSDCQKHEDITVRWRDGDYSVIISLYHTWRNDLRLYNRMILATTIIITIIMFIYSGIVVIWESWILIYHPPVPFVRSASRRAQMTLSDEKSSPRDSNENNALKMNALLLYCFTWTLSFKHVHRKNVLHEHKLLNLFIFLDSRLQVETVLWNCLCQYVSRPVCKAISFSQKAADRIFLKFSMKL